MKMGETNPLNVVHSAKNTVATQDPLVETADGTRSANRRAHRPTGARSMSSTPESRRNRPTHGAGFHEGERAVQARAGLSDEAERLEGMLAPATLGGGAATFLGMQRFAVLAARDGQGALWASPLVGAAGFLHGEGQTLRIAAKPDDDDPLDEVAAGQYAAVITLDLQRRRRMRVNGWLAGVGRDGLTMDVEEAYGNCPSYIQQRSVHPSRTVTGPHTHSAMTAGSMLTAEAEEIVTTADTLFIATQHPQRGTDVSHKGGNPGFVRIEGADIMWPDYAGNNMFNTMGNLVIDNSAGLLFIDFEADMVLQLSGTATLDWGSSEETSADTSTGRWVRFRPQHGLVRGSVLHSSSAPVMSPHNPPIATAD